ncbi:MAG TPA: sterol desaturase family protein [Thermoanaerobaculia bacterium]|nr:sterol desaturase family protein [Thermoanaerobaculia bacterium]
MHEFLARHAFLHDLAASTLIGLGVYVLCALIIIGAELAGRRDMSIYRTPNALNDLAYAVFYQCSIYNLLVSPLFALLTPRLHFLRAGLLLNMPPAAALIVCWIIFDFLNYWTHRLLHSVRPLWAFHSVHHTQTRLTFLSANRIHVLEQVTTGILMIVPAFLLGIPQPRWLPLLLMQIFSETMQHARLSWTFGPLRRLLVSPAFHAVHHSTDKREYNGNYGRVFSVWDALFGTYVHSEERERRYGVDGMDVPEKLTAQLAHPFRVLAGRV